MAFQEIAPFYDKLMRSVPYEAWADYLELLIIHQEIQAKSLLDVCCGTGAVTEIMAYRGYQCTGFDLSAPMIELARTKAAERDFDIRYEVADACTVDLGIKVDVAFSFFDSLNYITSAQGFHDAVQCIGKHVRPGGLFVFDLNTAYAFEAEMFTQKDLKPRSEIKYKWEGNYNRETRIISVEMDFWVGEETYHETHIQRAHSPEEALHALRTAGFERIQVFESYTLDPPRRNSDRVHYVAQKTGLNP